MMQMITGLALAWLHSSALTATWFLKLPGGPERKGLPGQKL